MPNEKLIDFWKPMLFSLLIGMPLGFGATLIGVDAQGILLNGVLKNTVLGLVLFGTYCVLLGVASIAGACYQNTEKLEKWINLISVPKWMSTISGVLIGIAIAALCKKTGIDFAKLLFSAILFLAITWSTRAYEIEVLGKAREGNNLRFRAWFGPIASLVIGCIALCMAWHRVCSCGA